MKLSLKKFFGKKTSDKEKIDDDLAVAEAFVTRGKSTARDKDKVEYMPASNYQIVDGVLYFQQGLTDVQGALPNEVKEQIREVVIPDSVISIGYGVFSNCKNLQTVKFGENVETLGEKIFSSSGLVSVVLPKKLKKIPVSAFENCEQLESVEMGDSVKYLGKYCFKGSGIKDIKLSKNLHTINTFAFAGCGNLEHIALNDKLCEIGDNAFAKSGIKEISLPDGIEVLPDCCFDMCANLKAVKLPKNLKQINSTCFNESGLVSVDIPESVEDIGSYAFRGCKDLQVINLPNSLRKLGKDSLCGTAIQKLHLPKSVESLHQKFQNMPNLKEIVVENGAILSMSKIFSNSSIERVVLKDYYFTKDGYSKYINDGCLSGCNNLKKVAFEIKDVKGQSHIVDIDLKRISYIMPYGGTSKKRYYPYDKRNRYVYANEYLSTDDIVYDEVVGYGMDENTRRLSYIVQTYYGKK